MRKQTSVEWLQEVYQTQGKFLTTQFEQAKEIHKQEIVDAINLPSEKRWYNALLYNNSGEQYYNKTYEK
jgi:hypothetical protein